MMSLEKLSCTELFSETQGYKLLEKTNIFFCVAFYLSGWSNANVLGNFQCRVVLLTELTVGKDSAVFVGGAGWRCFFFFIRVHPPRSSPRLWGEGSTSPPYG